MNKCVPQQHLVVIRGTAALSIYQFNYEQYSEFSASPVLLQPVIQMDLFGDYL